MKYLNHRIGENRIPERIAIVRSLPGLGDWLCCVPALRALRSALPNAHITLIGLATTAGFVQRFRHYVDRQLEFPGYPGIPEIPLAAAQVTAFLTKVQQLEFDLALQMHGNGSCMNGFTLLLGAKQTAGFYPSGGYCPDPNSFLPYPEHEPEIWRHLRLMEFLGVPLQGEWLEFPLQARDWQELRSLTVEHRLNHNYVCIHPGASVATRRWSGQNFATIADALAARGFQIVLTGTSAEVEVVNAVVQAMHFPAVNLAGKTELGTLAALVKHSRLVICNDTGVSHLAAALQVNSVVVFSDSDPNRWTPLDRSRHRPVQTSSQDGVAAVLAHAIDLLSREFAYAS